MATLTTWFADADEAGYDENDKEQMVEALVGGLAAAHVNYDAVTSGFVQEQADAAMEVVHSVETETEM